MDTPWIEISSCYYSSITRFCYVFYKLITTSSYTSCPFYFSWGTIFDYHSIALAAIRQCILSYLDWTPFKISSCYISSITCFCYRLDAIIITSSYTSCPFYFSCVTVFDYHSIRISNNIAIRQCIISYLNFITFKVSSCYYSSITCYGYWFYFIIKISSYTSCPFYFSFSTIFD